MFTPSGSLPEVTLDLFHMGVFHPLHGCDHWSVEGVPLPELLFLQGMYAWSISNKLCYYPSFC